MTQRETFSLALVALLFRIPEIYRNFLIFLSISSKNMLLGAIHWAEIKHAYFKKVRVHGKEGDGCVTSVNPLKWLQ